MYCRIATGDNIMPLDRLLVTQQVVSHYEHASGHYLCAHKRIEVVRVSLTSSSKYGISK